MLINPTKMPVSARISDAELRQRLLDHAYNVPPITATTRSMLIKKLNQLDSQRVQSAQSTRKQGGYLDYSSAEDEDFAPPQASSTRKNGGGVRNAPQSASRARVTRSSRQSSRSGTPVSQTQPRRQTNGNRSSRRNISLMTHSETEEGSEDEEEEEDEICEEEEEGSEDSEEEGDVGSNGVDRVDLAVQTSLGESPSQSPGQSIRFRGQRFTSTPSSSFLASSVGNDRDHSTGTYNGGRLGPSCSSAATTYSIMSPVLRKNLNKFGSLNEALSTLPSQKSGSNGLSHSSSINENTSNHTPPPSPVTQATPRNSSSSFRASEERRSCNSMTISMLIISTALLFFLFIAYQYRNLKPDVTTSHRVPVCKGLPSEQPHVNCVPQAQMNPTVKMFSVVAKLLQSHGLDQLCHKGSSNISLPLDQISNHIAKESKLVGMELREIFQNFQLLVRENPGWNIGLTEPTTEQPFSHMVHMDLPLSWRCWLTLKVTWLGDVLQSLVGVVAWGLGAVAILSMLVWLWRKWSEMIEKRNKEVFELVEQVLNILYHHHQGVLREGKIGSPFYPILHIRDQLIPPPERSKKAVIWKKVEDYMRNKESRVREDIQKVYGEEYKVWQWLPDIPWSPGVTPGATPSRNTGAAPGITPSRNLPSPGAPTGPSHQISPPQSPPGASSQWGQPPTTSVTPGWQGSAFQLGKHVAAPVAPPTSCLKVRHLFDVQKQGPGWVVTVKEEILRRCLDAQVLHIAVDTESPEGTVYIKTMSPEDAGKVFRCLHGQWYRGQLVTAKYLRLDRYHERFPDSRNARVPLKSNK